MKTELMVAAAIIACVLLTGILEKRSLPAEAQVIAASPKPITHYTITQDSPGLYFYERRGYEKAPLPLTPPLEKKQ